jgi:ribosomal protein L22
MSEEPTDEQTPKEQEKAKPASAGKPAAAKKPAAKKPTTAKKVTEAEGSDAETLTEAKPARASKATAKEKPVAKKSAGGASTEDESAKPPSKRAAAKKRAEREPVGERADAGKLETSVAPETEKPVAAKAERPAAAARRDTEPATPTVRRKIVRAQARYVRTSARKARMVCGHLRGKSVGEARAILAFTPREVARDWSKLLESAVANAENNHELIEDDLLVREAYADEGPTIKRFRPRAQGRATPIRKRTSHLTITLTPKP